jgi:signal transduction histidine kinase
MYYLDKDEAEKAFLFIEQAYQFALKNSNTTGIISGLHRYAMYYNIRKEYKTQLRYAKEELQVAESTDRPDFINTAEIDVMKAYYYLKDYKTAFYHGERLLVRIKEDDWWALKQVYSWMMKIYALTGNQEKTEEYFVKYLNIEQKLSDENMQNALQEMEIKYEVQQKEEELARQQAEIKREKMLRNITISGLAVALLIIVLTTYIIRLRNRRNRELADMNETKNKFFRIISHDLKNPAVMQRNALQLLLDNSNQWDADSLTKYYRELLKSADNQINLLYNLLNWAQMQTGQMPYAPVSFDIIGALQSDLYLIKNMAERKGITFETQIPETAILTGDANMLTTVVRNLLTNAVKFTGNGGTVTLDIIKHESRKQKAESNLTLLQSSDLTVSEKDGYTISITDTGTGMNAEQLQNLFKIDHRSSQKGTSGEQGSGIGLIVCKELLEKHGSKLNIESEEGKGSRFWVVISG